MAAEKKSGKAEKTSGRTRSVRPKPPRRSAAEEKKHRALAGELVSLIPELDSEGLAFLVEQAKVHLYNMHIDEQTAENAALPQAAERKQPEGFRIEAADGGASYYIVFGGNWKLFTDEELLAVMRILSGAGTDREAASRLFRWSERERADVLYDFPISQSDAPALAQLIALLKKTFTVKHS